MSQTSPEPIKLPHDQHVARAQHRLETSFEAGAIIALAGNAVLVDRLGSDAGRSEHVPLQIEALRAARPSTPVRIR